MTRCFFITLPLCNLVPQAESLPKRANPRTTPNPFFLPPVHRRPDIGARESPKSFEAKQKEKNKKNATREKMTMRIMKRTCSGPVAFEFGRSRRRDARRPAEASGNANAIVARNIHNLFLDIIHHFLFVNISSFHFSFFRYAKAALNFGKSIPIAPRLVDVREDDDNSHHFLWPAAFEPADRKRFYFDIIKFDNILNNRERKMIQSFGDKRTRAIYEGDAPRDYPPELIRNAVIRLEQLNYVERVESLRLPPSNRLEKLGGRGKAFWSIRINDRWRIIFKWTDAGPADVQIIDYHR